MKRKRRRWEYKKSALVLFAFGENLPAVQIERETDEIKESGLAVFQPVFL
jgi:hypothetical protein